MKKIYFSCCFLLLSLWAKAQYYEVYKGILGGEPMELIWTEKADGQLEAYYIDINRRQRFPLVGEYHQEGQYWSFESQESPQSWRLFLRARWGQKGRLDGIYYREDKLRSFADMRQQNASKRNPEQLIEAVNGIYRDFLAQNNLPQRQTDLPFSQDEQTGIYFLAENEPTPLPSGLSLAGREMQRYQAMQVFFDDFSGDGKKLSLYFQVLTYYPNMQLMVWAEEQNENGQTLTLGVYQQNRRNWELTKDVLQEKSWAELAERLPKGAKISKKGAFYQLELGQNPLQIDLGTPLSSFYDKKKPLFRLFWEKGHLLIR